MRPARRQGLRLSLNRHMGASLRTLMSRGHDNSWFTEHLVRSFERMQADSTCPIEPCVFELWDAADGSVLAMTAGYAVGSAFHDFSMFTFTRDKVRRPSPTGPARDAPARGAQADVRAPRCCRRRRRRAQRSAGAVLTRTVGHLLRECGFGLWYWGYKNAYMHEYDSYGGSTFGRLEFKVRWQPLADEERSTGTRLGLLQSCIASGKALVQPLEQSAAVAAAELGPEPEPEPEPEGAGT